MSDGGAATTGYAQACLDNWLVTQRQQPVKWDVILFNSGLHNLDNSSSAEQCVTENRLAVALGLAAPRK